jgi:hypothetical protein
MTVFVTLVTESELLLHLVSDYARGLGCDVDGAANPARGSIRIEVDDDRSLVELLTHVALGAAKAGIAVSEPLCQVTYRHAGVTSDVILTLRIAEFRIDTAARVDA